MKRILILTLLACLLLTACGKGGTEATTTATTAPTVTEQTPAATQAQTTPPTEPATQDATEPATQGATEPSQPQTVTVYLLDKAHICDYGPFQVNYDSNYNITGYTVHNMEDELMYTVHFKEHDANGMACQIKTEWTSGDTQVSTLKYFQDGKIQEELFDWGNFNGFQYAYDEAGNMTEKREYYEGVLDRIVLYQYDGQTLTGVHCEDSTGKKLSECKVENGRIVEEISYEYSDSQSILYTYDKNGNLTQTTFRIDGETTPDVTYEYKAVEVEFSRAQYLIYQQQYLLGKI